MVGSGMAVGRTLRELWVSEPGELFPLLPAVTRMDMLDYYDSGQIVSAPNNLGHDTELVTVEENYISLETSASQTVEMRLLTQGRDTVIAVIETVATPVEDSRISFYTTSWIPLRPGQVWKQQPSMATFVRQGVSKDDRKALLDRIAFPLIALHFTGPMHSQIVARHGLNEFLTKEDYSEIRNQLTDSVMYRIDGCRIKPMR